MRERLSQPENGKRIHADNDKPPPTFIKVYKYNKRPGFSLQYKKRPGFSLQSRRSATASLLIR